MTEIVSKNQINHVIDILMSDGVVAFPTETVFGVGVRFGSHKAIDALMEAKKRDYSKAITLMVPYQEDIQKYAVVDEISQKIIDHFMPGMLTLVLKKKESVDSYMTNGKETIGIRIPDDEYVLSLLKKVGPMLVTSANLSNHPNTTTTQEVLEQLNHRIDVVVDGKTQQRVASTVVEVIDHQINILREGQISSENLKEIIK